MLRLCSIAIFYTLFASFSAPEVSAQRFPYTFEQIRLDGNTLDNLIFSMLKDSRGYLWLGTANGLKRYDPTFTVSYTKIKNNKHSLVHNNIGVLCEDHQGRIWIGTTEGVCFLDRQTNRFTRIEAVNRPDFACRSIICDAQGDIWFTIRDGGLYKFETKTNKLRNFRHDDAKPNSLSSNRILVNGLVEDPSKKGLWIACQDKLNYLDFASQTFYHSDHNPLQIPILTPGPKSALTLHQNLLVYSDNATNEICWYNTALRRIAKTFKVLDKQGNSHASFYKIFFDSNNDLWIGTYENIMFYVNAALTKTILIQDEKRHKNAFTVNAFNDIIQEENGTIWFSTLKGLSTISGLDVKYPNEQLYSIYDFSRKMFDEFQDDAILDFVEDSQDNTWWFVTIQNRIFNYNPTTDQYREFRVPKNPEFPEFDFPCSLKEHHNKLLIVKRHNIYSFDKRTHRFDEIKLQKDLGIAPPYKIESAMVLGDSLWVFRNAQKSLSVYSYHFQKKSWSTYPVVFQADTPQSNESRNLFVAHALVTKKGDFWLAVHSGGLAKFDHKRRRFEVIKTKQVIDFTKVGYTGLGEDPEGNIWIATYDLVKFNPLTYDFESILDLDIIGSMQVDDYGNVCMATLDEFMFFKEKTNEKYSFSIASNTFFDSWGNSLNKLRNSTLLSRNSQSAIVINFKGLKLPSSNDKLYIARVQAADSVIQVHENNQRIDFKAEQNSISIAYGVLSPPNTSLYKYHYRLDGFDSDWRLDRSQSRYAIYGNLDGGEYVFRVKAEDVNGKFLEENTIIIHIATPFYKTLWFKLSWLVVFVGLAVAFVRYRANQRKRIHHLELQSTRLEKDKTEIQYQNLINHLNPHFLFNSLTSLNSLIITEPKTASKFLQKLSAMYRYILQSKDKETVTLEEELNFVKNYIELQQSRFEQGLIFEINIEDEYLDDAIVPVTLQNLFENAIKHNIIEDDSPLVIEVFVDNGYVVVRNNLQRKAFVETSNKQGLDSLVTLYSYLSSAAFEVSETPHHFIVKVPLI